MVTLIRSLPVHQLGKRWRLANKRFLFPVLLLVLLATPISREITVNVLADAFWQVAAYVAATLTIYHVISARMNQHGLLRTQLQHSRRFQVVFSAAMGALPGCGGAIIVMTQFVRGQLSFGSVVAVLTATMGDAAFLLLAAKPATGLLIVSIGFFVGLISGWLVDTIHGADFMRPTVTQETESSCCQPTSSQHNKAVRWQGMFWQWLLIPSVVFAVLGSLQVDTDVFFHLPEHTTAVLGAGLALLAMTLWSFSRDVQGYQDVVSEDPKPETTTLFQRVAQDTNFVTTWVISAFLCFEFIMTLTQWDLQHIFAGWGILMPLLGVLIGLIPGCGPQILVTSLFLQGAIPQSAQLGNAISNDGDALFPAIALAPKAALVATFYSSLPALLAGYSFYWIFE
ncbi:putative manganese transporter (plasmid) [Photobacterium sp. GJ3]|uniref:putative manganese transporter n=1 Tax=Photobacterium sp. GJ3 TaxID=2829502 RepID=UPI001B8B1AD8|nr:putative manganese transporter [Photobacterium sp. GJ3]QUJ69717.1 putative manganese transporter [Photobacterium sp. GJ3]